MRTRRLLAGLLLVLSLAACQTSAWKEFRSAEGAFSVLFPGTPTEATQQVNTDAGVIELKQYLLESKGFTYLVGHSNYPEATIAKSTPAKMLDGARNGAVANIQGKLLSELVITLQGNPGRELRIESADGKTTLQMRIFMVGPRLYQVLAISTNENASSRDIARFLDSFKLLRQ